MSNPGVINLANTNTSLGNFRVEDNFGEAIHFHIGEIRYDLTIKEFRTVADDVREAVSAFVDADGFDIDNFSNEFLTLIYYMLPDLESVDFKKVKLSELLFEQTSKHGFSKALSIEHSRVYKVLCGNAVENNHRVQINHFRQSNQQRADSMLQKIKESDYPFDNKYIVLFNDQKVVRDGQHRAACIYYLKGDCEIPVMVCHFKDNKYNYKPDTILNKTFNFFKPKNLLRKLAKLYRKICK